MSSKNNDCNNCPMNKFCTNRLDAEPKIIKRCNNLDFKNRVKFANKKKLIPNMEESFASFFLDFHSYNGILISIEILKYHFENPNQIFPDSDPLFIKENCF